MTMKRRILCSLILSLAMVIQSQITLAQTSSIKTAVYADKTRFESQEENTEFRVEVFNSSGQKMFDSGFVAGRTLDWNMLDQQGERVADGIYDYVVTVKNRHGKERATQSRQLPIFREGQDLEKAPTLVQLAANDKPSGNVTGSGTAGQITKWTDATTLGDSVITENSGKVGIGTSNPISLLHIIGSHPSTSTLAGTNATEGLRVGGGKGGDTSGSGQTGGIGANVVLQAGDGGDALSGTSGRGGFVTIQPGAAGVGAVHGGFGQVILAPGGGNVGIGITNAGSKLTVAGMIETTLGGLKFPDGTLQTTAATSGLASIFHDTTLAGNGTSGSPLGVSNSGVGTNQLTDNAVTTAKIASGQVVKNLNGLVDNVSLAAGANITITPSGGSTLTVAAPAALTTVAHDGTLTGTGTAVSPLSLAVATAAEQPFQVEGSIDFTDGLINAGGNLFIVPSNKRLVIEFANGSASVPVGQTIPLLSINTIVGGEFAHHYLVPVRTGTSAFSLKDIFIFSQQMVFHADPGTTVFLSAQRGSDTGFGEITFSISGRLVDVP